MTSRHFKSLAKTIRCSKHIFTHDRHVYALKSPLGQTTESNAALARWSIVNGRESLLNVQCFPTGPLVAGIRLCRC